MCLTQLICAQCFTYISSFNPIMIILWNGAGSIITERSDQIAGEGQYQDPGSPVNKKP